MRYALDTNIIIYAVAHHLRLKGAYPARYIASARLFARRRAGLVIPACFLGEAFHGAGSDQQKLDMVVALCVKLTQIVEPTRNDLVNSIMLRRQLMRGDASRIDCLGYTRAARATKGVFVSYDDGFIGTQNRIRVPAAYRQVTHKQPLDCSNAEECMSTKINPRRKPKAKKDPLLVEWEKRANAAARAAGARTDVEIARFFCGTARAVMETYGG